MQLTHQDSPKDDGNHALEVMLKEYETATLQVTRWLETDERVFEISLIAWGVALTASSIIITQRVYGFLLLLSLPFYVLSWAQIRRNVVQSLLRNYIRTTLAPQIDILCRKSLPLKTLSGEDFSFIAWEGYIYMKRTSSLFTNFILRAPLIGKVALQIGVAVILIAMYLVLSRNDRQYVGLAYVDETLLILNALLTLFSVLFSVSGYFIGTRTK